MRWLALVAWAAATAVAARAEGLHPAHALVWTSEAYGAPRGVQHADDDKGRVAYQAVHTGQLAASLANLLHSGAHDSGGACAFPVSDSPSSHTRQSHVSFANGIGRPLRGRPSYRPAAQRPSPGPPSSTDPFASCASTTKPKLASGFVWIRGVCGYVWCVCVCVLLLCVSATQTLLVKGAAD